MTTTLTTSGISGTDGAVPIYEPDGRWTIWSKDELYFGGAATGKYIPKVKDYVVDTDTNEYFIVISIDPTTMIPTLKSIGDQIKVGNFSDTDVLLGVGPGTQADTYRIYIDTSVIPHTLAVDKRLFVNGVDAVSCKIFRGSDLTANQKVISAIYDGSGHVTSQAIPLELAAMPDAQNYAVKTVPVCYTTEEVPDGEVLTAVFYSSAGGVVSKRQLLAENTAFIRSSNAAVKYVMGISLETPFLSRSDPNLIEYPINVPLSGLNLIGVVQYSDGSTKRMPVDGTKFSIFGFRDYVATIVGQQIPLVLNYALSSDEIAYGANAGETRTMPQIYSATTIRADGAYSVKLFGYPVWIDAINGYRLEWYLFSLDRQVYYRVTDYVKINTNLAAFSPKAYGVAQELSVSVNLKDVNAAYNSYIHTQTIEITLIAPATDRTSDWTIRFDPGQTPPYGANNHADTIFTNANLWSVSIDMGETDLTTWLDRVYGRTKPLYDDQREVAPLVPTHFAFVLGLTEVTYPIAEWNMQHTIGTAPPADSSTLFVKFFQRTADNDLQLAIAGLPVWQQN